MTFDQPMLQLNYTSGDELAYETSFAGAAVAAGAVTSAGAVSATGGGAYSAPASAQGAPAMAAQPQQAQQAVAVQQRHVEQKLGRNDPCWCGSGKKFKKCHGA
jgi:preprotein translocase subunit SecA